MAKSVDLGTMKARLELDVQKWTRTMTLAKAEAAKHSSSMERYYSSIAKSAQKELGKAEKEIENINKGLKDTDKTSKKSTSSLEGYFAAMQGVLGNINIEGTLRGFTEAFGQQQAQLDRLTTQLQLNGRVVNEVSGDYQEFAKSLAGVTTYNDVAIIGLLRQAEAFGLTGTTAKRAVENAVALADQFDMSAESALNLTLELQRGNSQGLEPYITNLRYMSDEGQRFAHSSRQMQTMFDAMVERSSKVKGEIAKLQAIWLDFKEQFGEPIAKLIQPLIHGFRLAVERLKDMDIQVRQNILSVAGLAGAFLAFGPVMRVLTPVISMMTGPGFGALKLLGSLFSVKPLFTFSTILTNIVKLVPILAKSLMGLLNPLTYIRGAVALIRTAFLGIFSPLTLILIPLTLIGAALYKLIKDTTGFGDLWDTLKQTGIAVWNWLKPIFKQLGAIAIAAFQLIMEGVEALGDFVLGIFAWILGETTVDWGRIQEIILQALIAVEFGLRNWRPVFDLATRYATWKVTELFNVISHFFTKTVPYTLGWFSRNWMGVFGWIGGNIITWMRSISSSWTSWLLGMGSNLASFLANPAAGFSIGAIDLIQDLPTDWGSYIQEGFSAPERVVPELERRLRREYESLQGSILESWREFYRRRLAELRASNEDIAGERRHDQQMIERDHRWTIRQYESLNASLMGTSESLAKILQYREDVLGSRVAQTTQTVPRERTAPGTTSSGTSTTPASIASGWGWFGNSAERNQQLTNIGNTLNAMLQVLRDAPPVNLPNQL